MSDSSTRLRPIQNARSLGLRADGTSSKLWPRCGAICTAGISDLSVVAGGAVLVLVPFFA